MIKSINWHGIPKQANPHYTALVYAISIFCTDTGYIP
uniref:Uncharacterized protein n=1 Tax=Anguilla anguilla TaxID=7936 RepID=A0A0E9UHZ8_ANGAN